MPIWSGGPPESHAPSGYTSRRMSWPMILLAEHPAFRADEGLLED